MTIRVTLHHQTIYRYDRSVQLSPHVVRLRPAPHCRTPIRAYTLAVEPRRHFLNWQQDPYGNFLARLVFPEPARELSIQVALTAELTVINPFEFFLEPSAEKYPFVYEPQLARELGPFLETAPAGPHLQRLVAELRTDKTPSVDYLVAINRRLSQDIRYIIRMEPGVQSPEETLTRRSGSCRDTGWLLVQVLRHLGLAARFVSGYLIQLVPDVKPLDGPAGPAADFTDLHAWAEVYLPGAGWVGLDPTSGLFAGEGHLPLACAADPPSAAPVSGSFTWESASRHSKDEKVEVQFDVRMNVTRIEETPRVTRPYTPEQWQAIDALGRQLDGDLRANDVRLTMGGEPTFIALDNPDAAEWNTAALGPHKRRLAGDLLRRLRDRFAPGAALLFGQGKWYPGEPLPRWALNCYWRADGEPIWTDPALIAEDERDYGHNETTAQTFAHAVANRLGVDPSTMVPAHEDAWYYLWREQRLPTNVDPHASNLDDAQERERLARVFAQGLGRVVGYALPLARRRFSPARWVTGPWSLREGRLYLLPGDSPMGLRLPLDTLPWAPPNQRETVHEPDPFAPREPLQPRSPRMAAEAMPTAFVAEQRLEPGRPATGVIRTALCVEARAGRLHVFLPPLGECEDFLDLVRAVEETAAALGMPVQLEGYPPPYDPRLLHFSVTPDPGVIEVNIHPAHDWNALVANTTALYEEARAARLGTEKFLPDGRATGTGGGNHVLLGGPTPADSPLLRRPDLLRSLLAFWHNHPALSYVFSGLFIGPTSQAPRLDEARNDSLYELEIAFRQIPEGGAVPPWLVDRLFRHLLTDVTGNTHRAEFCIDKLYSPDTASGRRGLLELRAFEMPPHAHMSLVQQLLVRALVARFWREPYRHGLARWGTELHDRFLLPHFLEQDLGDVLTELRGAGYPLESAWFAPHLEFRFPALGEVLYRDLVLELRQAIEPWHVLGEEALAGGTARFVDATVERLQVKVRGWTDPRHVLTCNGRQVPLQPTGTNGEYVAGVRFRAWQLPSSLHPTVPIQAPLRFDLVDTWLGQSVAGCRYHTDHPGGRNTEQAPVNAAAAESRRAARFFAFGHTPGPLTVLTPEVCPEFPLTLDLRRPTMLDDRRSGR